MSTSNFLQIKPNGINLPSNTSTIVANPGDLAYNSTSNKYAIYNTASDFLITESTASSTIAGLTNSNLSGSAGITNANLASMASNTVKANKTGSPATPSDVALGSLTEATSAVLTITGTNTTIGATTIQVIQAGASTSGYLSSSDWNSFHTTAGAAITALTGDVTATGPGSVAASIVATTNSTITTLTALASVGTITTGTWNATTIAINHGGTGQVTKAAAFDALSPNTTKGDITVNTGSTNARQGIGSDGQILVADSTQTNGLKWSTLSQGAKNYIVFNNFENNSTTGWSLGTVGTLTNGIPTGSPTFGSGASGNLSFTTVSSGVLAGSFSGSLVSSAATTQGNMLATQSYAIDAEDQAKVLTFKFYYSIPSGVANANFSGTSSNSFGIAVYDVTNSSFLTSTANFGMTQTTGAGYVTGTCQTNSNTANLRFVIYNANATAGAITLNVDDFFLGPQTAPLGAVVTDPVAYTPVFTGLGTVTSSTAEYRRVGANLEVWFSLTSGTTTATATSISIPSGLVVDSSKISSPTIIGHFGANSSPNGGDLVVIGSNPTTVAFTANNANFNTASNGNSWVSTTQFSGFFSVPITGWSSNVQMSNDTDTRVCAASYYVSSSATPGTGNPFNYDTKLFDTHGAVTTGSGWKFTAPISGIYQVTGTINTGGTLGNILLYKNGSSFVYLGSSSADTFPTPCTTIQLNAGDFIDVRSAVNATWNGGSAPYLSIININRLSGPSVIAATESVNASYGLTTGGVVSANAVIKYDTKVKDTHNAFSTSTGLYTMPISGSYLLTLQGNAASASFDLYIKINGVSKNYLMGDTGAGRTFSGAIILPYNAGDTVGVYTDATNTFGGPSTNGYLNFFSICRVGN